MPEILGEKSYRTLEEIPEPVDIVNIFRRSEMIPPVVDSAIAIGAKVVMDAGRHSEPRSRRKGSRRRS